MAKYIAKVDENNVVETVITLEKKKIINPDGTVSSDKAVALAKKVAGEGTWILYDQETMRGQYPSVECIWTGTFFHEPRPNDRNGNPCTSWQLNNDREWFAPHTPTDLDRMRIEWDEAQQKWYSKPSGSLGETAAWSTWNTSTEAWEEVQDKKWQKQIQVN